jgi:hypothetical protein
LELSLIDCGAESQPRQVNGYSLTPGTALIRTTLHFRPQSGSRNLATLSVSRCYRGTTTQRSPYHPLQGNQGRKDKGNDAGEGDGEEDVVHGDQGLLFDVNSITRRAANRAILVAFTP